VAPAIALGVAKFNVGTVLKHEFWDGLKVAVAAAGANPDVHQLLGSHKGTDATAIAQERMTAKVRSLIRRYGGSGRQAMAPEAGAE
jgi:fructose-bisphosphate aldolase class II